MIIDFHTHAFPDRIAAHAMQSLSASVPYPPETDGTVRSLLHQMDVWGVDRAVICNIATNPRQMANVNRFALETRDAYGERLIPLGSVHPMAPDALDTLAQLHANGIPGIKLHPDYMGLSIDDSHYAPILDTAAALGMFVILHAGVDPYSPQKMHASADGILRVLAEHPKLRLIAAHYGNNLRWDEAEEKLIGKPLWIDCSLGVREGISPAQAKRILSKHDEDRILFGSDCPWCSARENITFIESLGLPAARLDKLFHKNAEALLI